MDVCTSSSREEDINVAGQVAVHLWCLWQNRNDKVWSDHMMNAVQVGQLSFSMWQSWYAGSRIPAITRLLTSLFEKELSRTLNASECVARGCALQCAMLSPVSCVEEYEVDDSTPFSIGLSSDEGPICENSNGILFPKGEPIPSSKTLTLQSSNLLHLEAFYPNLHELPKGISPKIGCFTIGPLHESDGSKAGVEVIFQLNLHGIVDIESSTLIEDHMEDSVRTRDNHSNSDAMDVEPISETDQNVNEHSINQKSGSPYSSEKVGEIASTEKLHNVVFEWLKEMEKLIEEEENLKTREELEIPNYDCSLTRVLCVDHRIRYRMYREMRDRIKALNSKCEFKQFSTTIPPLEYFSSGFFLSFEPIKEASERLIAALQVNNCDIIGLDGKRGSGKTKLVKAIGEKAKYLNIFDVVLFANVSQNPNVRRIQDEIADSLDMKFDRNTDVGRARTIHSTLESMGRVLVILDDVQTKIELEHIGIPVLTRSRSTPDSNTGCVVLLTTRRQRECALMDCKKEFPLGPLSNDEAWTLLKKHSGIDDESSSDILNVAHQVVYECEGLPGTIKEVGSSLKSKPVEEWKASLDNLKHSMAQWQIFISFRGEDTRYSFTGFLYDALCRGGFKTFMDDSGGLHKRDQISPALINAIEASRLSIVVLSENYASSSWCLDELAKIIECMQLCNQLVWPIFYNVEPTNIRKLENNYGESMTKHEQQLGSDSERLQKWKSALAKVTDLAGETYKIAGYEYEYKFIQKIVEDADKIKNRLYIRSVDMD